MGSVLITVHNYWMRLWLDIHAASIRWKLCVLFSSQEDEGVYVTLLHA